MSKMINFIISILIILSCSFKAKKENILKISKNKITLIQNKDSLTCKTVKDAKKILLEQKENIKNDTLKIILYDASAENFSSILLYTQTLKLDKVKTEVNERFFTFPYKTNTNSAY